MSGATVRVVTIVAAQAAAAITWALLPPGVAADWLQAAFAPAAATIVAWGLRSAVGPGRRGWVLLLGALVALSAAGLVAVLDERGAIAVAAWVAAAIRLGGPLLVLAAIGYVAWVRGQARDRGALIEVTIVAIMLFSVLWVAVVREALTSQQPATPVELTVAGSALYLLAAAVATSVFFTPGRQQPGVLLCLGSTFVLFAGSVLDGWRLVGGAVDAVALSLLAGAALFPRIGPGPRGEPARPGSTGGGSLSPLHLVALTLVSVVPTVILIARAAEGIAQSEVAAYGTCAVLVTLATLLRTAWLVRAGRRAFAREAILRHAASALAASQQREAIHRAAVDNALAFIDDPRARSTLSLIGHEGITVVAAAGFESERIVGLELPRGSLELVRRAAGQASIEVNASLLPTAGLISGEDPVTFFPLVVGGAEFGLLGIRTTRPLPADERSALEGLAAQVALALDGLLQAEESANMRVEHRFGALVRHASDLVTLVDERMQVRYQSPSIETALGWTVDEVAGRTPLSLIHPDDRSRILLHWRQVAAVPGTHSPVDFRARTRKGDWVTVETIANNLLDDPEVRGIVLTSRDISERRHLETRLAHQAFHDELTGLANRALFNDRVAHSLAVADRESRSVAVLFLDLDDFKEVNDSLGHQAGDAVLIEAAQRIETCLRQGDTAARLSGDEFGILLERATRESATSVAERVLEQLREPITIIGKELFVRGSIGIALSPADGDSAEELLRNADTAMYRAKGAGKSSFALFQESMHHAALERLELRSELEGATTRGEMSLHYQPIFDLGSGAVAGFEALLRWAHPTRGSIPPAAFVPLAEETGTIVQLGAWVFETAVEQLAAWDRSWPDQAGKLWLSVNLSTRQLAEPSLPRTIVAAIRATGVAPERLIVEVTESVLATDTEAAASRLAELRAIGLRVAIDDFGTGYSSLGVLEQMPVDVLKIAARFVERLGTDAPRPRLVEAVVRLGDTLSLPTVAEGIENVTQLTVLQLLGCEMGQGFFLSRPLRTEDVDELLARAAAGDPLIVGTPRSG